MPTADSALDRTKETELLSDDEGAGLTLKGQCTVCGTARTLTPAKRLVKVHQHRKQSCPGAGLPPVAGTICETSAPSAPAAHGPVRTGLWNLAPDVPAVAGGDNRSAPERTRHVHRIAVAIAVAVAVIGGLTWLVVGTAGPDRSGSAAGPGPAPIEAPSAAATEPPIAAAPEVVEAAGGIYGHSPADVSLPPYAGPYSVGDDGTISSFDVDLTKAAGQSVALSEAKQIVLPLLPQGARWGRVSAQEQCLNVEILGVAHEPASVAFFSAPYGALEDFKDFEITAATVLNSAFGAGAPC